MSDFGNLYHTPSDGTIKDYKGSTDVTLGNSTNPITAIAATTINADTTLKSNGVDVAVSDYASINVRGNSTASTINYANSFVEIQIFDTNGQNNISVPGQTFNQIELGATADYEVTFSCSAESAAANKRFEILPYKLFASQKTVSGVTQANPAVVTTTSAHGFENGQEVYFSSVGGMVELNKRIFKIANKTATTFELQDDTSTDVDSSGYTAYTSGGNVQRAGATYTYINHYFTAGGTGEVMQLSNSDTYPFADGDNVRVFVKNATDTTNITFNAANLAVSRRG